MKGIYLVLLFTLHIFSSAVAVETEDSGYTLKKDDTVRMTVFQEEDLATEAQIGKSGSVSFPLIGNVQLIGLTVKQAELKVKELYEVEFLVNAQVNVTVLAYAEKWVVIGGDVRSPGTIKMPEEGALDLRGAIAQAGGVTETANTGDIVVRSKAGNIRRLSLDGSGSVVLKHGDNVTVGRSSLSTSTFTVTGHVSSPGVIEFPKSGGMDILTALAKSGGFGRLANRKEVVVKRGDKQYNVNIKAITDGNGQMFYMRPGDILIVKESKW